MPRLIRHLVFSRCWAAALVVLVGCLAPDASGPAPVESTVESAANAPEPRTSQQDEEPAANQTPKSNSIAAARDSRPVRPLPKPELEEGHYLFRMDLAPQKRLYYLVECEYRDHVHLLIDVTTEVQDRRTIVQTVLPADAEMPRPPGHEHFVPVSWECTRHEVREKTSGKEELVYDSLRHLYPPGDLRELGGIAGSVVSFLVDPITGETRARKIQPAEFDRRGNPRRLPSAVEDCALSDVNVANLLDDICRLYLPESPVRVGETWTARRSKGVSKLGQIVIDYTFALADVHPVDDREIATIDVTGEIRLQDPAEEDTENPAKRNRSRSPDKQFKIDRTLCEGRVQFDLTRRELVTLLLRREVDLGVKVESEKMTIPIRKNSSQVLRVESRQSPPPLPVIVGERQPPKEPAEPKKSTAQRNTPRPRSLSRRSATTRPADKTATGSGSPSAGAAAARANRNKQNPKKPPSRRSPSSRPAVRGGRPPVTTQPAATQPAQTTPGRE